MCDNQPNNAPSLLIEERRRLIDKIDTRIYNRYFNQDNTLDNSIYDKFIVEPFENILKRKMDDNTPDHMTDRDVTNKKIKPTINKYFPVNIVTINVRGF